MTPAGRTLSLPKPHFSQAIHRKTEFATDGQVSLQTQSLGTDLLPEISKHPLHCPFMLR